MGKLERPLASGDGTTLKSLWTLNMFVGMIFLSPRLHDFQAALVLQLLHGMMHAIAINSRPAVPPCFPSDGSATWLHLPGGSWSLESASFLRVWKVVTDRYFWGVVSGCHPRPSPKLTTVAAQVAQSRELLRDLQHNSASWSAFFNSKRTPTEWTREVLNWAGPCPAIPRRQTFCRFGVLIFFLSL